MLRRSASSQVLNQTQPNLTDKKSPKTNRNNQNLESEECFRGRNTLRGSIVGRAYTAIRGCRDRRRFIEMFALTGAHVVILSSPAFLPCSPNGSILQQIGLRLVQIINHYEEVPFTEKNAGSKATGKPGRTT